MSGNTLHGVVFHEIMYHPDSENNRHEFIELYNPGSGTVSLAGWRVAGAVDHEFSAEAMIEGRGYLVVVADLPAFHDRYPGITNVVAGWNGALSNRRESLRLLDAEDNLVDQVTYADQGDWARRVEIPFNEKASAIGWQSDADGGGASMELINPILPTDSGQNWAESQVDLGTPGQANSVAQPDLPPLVLEVDHDPEIPGPGEAVVVTSKIRDERLDGLAVDLHWRIDSEPPVEFATLTMRDDGMDADAVADDQVFSVALPGQPLLTIVEFFIAARDAGGLSRTWPPPVDMLDGEPEQVGNLLFQVDTFEYDGDHPLYRLIAPERYRKILRTTGAPIHATFISRDGSGIRVRHRATVGSRGNSSRYVLPQSYRVNFARGDPWHRMVALNLNAQFGFLQVLGSALCRRAGLRAPHSTAVKVLLNGVDYHDAGHHPGITFGMYAANEVENSDFTDRVFPGDGNGNAYRGTREVAPADFDYRGEDPDPYRPSYQKATNESEDDWSDLIALCREFSLASEEEFASRIQDYVNVDDWLRHLAVMALMDNRESGLNTGTGDDYYIYRGIEDPRFYLIPHDLDSLFGNGSGLKGNPEAGVFGAAGIPALERLLKAPAFAPKYYRELRHQMENLYSRNQFDALVEQVLGSYVHPAAINNIQDWMERRRKFLRQALPWRLTVESDLPRDGESHIANTSKIDLTGHANAAETAAVEVAGFPAAWSAWEGAWAASGVGLAPGNNQIRIVSRGENGQALEEITFPVVYQPTGGTRLGGILAEDTTLSASQGPIVIESSLVVPTGVTLTVEAGISIYMNPGSNISIHGAASFLGNADQPIWIASASDEDRPWGTVLIEPGARGEFSFVHFDNGGSEGIAVEAREAELELTACEWRVSDATALEIDRTSSTVRDCRFHTFSGDAVHILSQGNEAGLWIFDNEFGASAFGGSAIRFEGVARPGTILEASGNVFRGGAGAGIVVVSGDAHLEGNEFTGFRPDFEERYAPALVGGLETKIVLVRSLMHDLETAWELASGAELTAEHVTISGVEKVLLVADSSGEPPKVTLRDSLLWDNEIGLTELTGPGAPTLSVVRSLFPDAEADSEAGNLARDPRFQDPPRDFHLKSDSPARQAGGFHRDMGAYVPVGPVVSGLPKLWYRSSHSLTVGGAGLRGYRYHLDDAPLSALFPLSRPLELSINAEGPHSLRLYGVNSAGRRLDPPLHLEWTVVLQTPIIQLNEILANNRSVLARDGEFPDFVEVYNPTAESIDLAEWTLTDTINEPSRFSFPPGATLGPGEYRLLYGGANPADPWRLGFGLNDDGEALHLFRDHGNLPVQSVRFGAQLPDYSIGRDDSGEWALNQPTPGWPNYTQPTADPEGLIVSEWMARPTAGSGGDYIEVFNSAHLPVALGGLGLSDYPAALPLRERIQELSFIAPLGFRIFQNEGEFHFPDALPLTFRLSGEGGLIGLSRANGEWIDTVIYGPQLPGRSEGRDGTIGKAWVRFESPTPGSGNPHRRQFVRNERTSIIAMDNVWQFNQSGRDLDRSWWLPGYQPTTEWPTGNGVFHIGGPWDSLPVGTELQFNDPQQVAFFFRFPFHYSGPLEDMAVDITHFFDDGGWVLLNGKRIYQYNVSASFSAYRPAVARIANPLRLGPITIPVSNLVHGENVLAVQLHQVIPDNDAAFGMELSLNHKVVESLPSQPLRLNEVLAQNRTHPVLNGPPADWVELVNLAATPIPLEGMTLSDNLQNPLRWSFPSGSQILPGEYLVVAFDPESPPSNWNTGFGLNAAGDSVFLFEPAEFGGALIDHVDFGLQIPDHSIGRVNEQWSLTPPTPGQPNHPARLGDPTSLKINEWMAQSTTGDDWFEIFNTSPLPVPLGGLWLADRLTAPLDSQLPPLSFIAGGPDGFVVFIADGNIDAGSDHVDFRLSAQGEAIGLFDAQRRPIDSITFGPQEADVSEGRWPDGDPETISALWPTPGGPNQADSDRDQIPDAWEQANGLDPDFTGDALLDPDRDGATHRQEFRQGSDPWNADAELMITQVFRDQDGLTLRFRGWAGHWYELQEREALGRGAWILRRELEPEDFPGLREMHVPIDSSNIKLYRLFAIPVMDSAP